MEASKNDIATLGMDLIRIRKAEELKAPKTPPAPVERIAARKLHKRKRKSPASLNAGLSITR